MLKGWSTEKKMHEKKIVFTHKRELQSKKKSHIVNGAEAMIWKSII